MYYCCIPSSILIFFSSSWDGVCHDLDRFVSRKERCVELYSAEKQLLSSSAYAVRCSSLLWLLAPTTRQWELERVTGLGVRLLDGCMRWVRMGSHIMDAGARRVNSSGKRQKRRERKRDWERESDRWMWEETDRDGSQLGSRLMDGQSITSSR